MKKAIKFIAFICIFTFVFVGCTQQSTNQTTKSTTQESTTIPTSIEMTQQEIIKMSNYMNDGKFDYLVLGYMECHLMTKEMVFYQKQKLTN